ncbi:receptor activity-modifying protein 1-like isoform X1 [Lampetra fluviatilis]
MSSRRAPLALCAALLALAAPVHACVEALLASAMQLCLQQFERRMMALGPRADWCTWELSARWYGELTNCTQAASRRRGCFWPSAAVDRFFAGAHRAFFSECPWEDTAPADPPPALLALLIAAPALLVATATGLIVWHSKRREGAI